MLAIFFCTFRTIRLPRDADLNKITAKLEEELGVLRIHIEKYEPGIAATVRAHLQR